MAAIREPHHDATLVDMAEYWRQVWAERAARRPHCAVAIATAELWKLRVAQERALASARENPNKAPGPETIAGAIFAKAPRPQDIAPDGADRT